MAMYEKPKAVVTDARLRISVTIARSLGRAGVNVVAAEAAGTPRPLAFHSKYVKSSLFLGPDAKTTLTDADMETLMDAAGEGGVLVPVFTPAVFKMSSDESKIEARAKVLVPPLPSLREAHDKARCTRLARVLGVPVPLTSSPVENGVDIRDTSAMLKWAQNLSYPVMLKYRSGEDAGLPAALRYRMCSSPEEVVEAYGQMDSVQSAPIAQEYVPGEDYGAALLYDRDSKPVASFTYRSIRERPRGAGPTVYAVSEDCPELADYSHLMLSALNWRGMAMVDFRRGLDGKFRFLEVNPRFWGSLALSVEAGVDFPLLYYRACLGEKIAPVRQKDGVRVRFFPGDLISLFEYARLPGNGAGYIARGIWDLLKNSPRDGLFSLSDPMPGLIHLTGGVFSRHARA